MNDQNRNQNRSNQNQNQSQNNRQDNKMKVVYVITERGGKNFWTRIGVAFVNSDGSLNVKLECLPFNGEIHIRDYVAREDGTDRLGA